MRGIVLANNKQIHIYDAVRLQTQNPDIKIRHKIWSLGYYVWMTPAGNFKYKTPEGDMSWDWLMPTHPKTGWEIIDE